MSMLPREPLPGPRVPPPGPAEPGAVLRLARGRRLVLGDTGLRVEVRSGPSWQTLRAVPYTEVAAAYTWQRQDWGYLVVGLFHWIGLMLGATLVVSALPGVMNSSWGLPVAAGAVTLVVATHTLYRITARPVRQLRVETRGTPLQVPCPDPAIFDALAARLAALHSPSTGEEA
jgi:hypothetical protein